MPPGAVTEAWTICSVLAAGNAFCQAAQLHLQLQSKHDAATCFVDAGNAFKKADPQGKGCDHRWQSRQEQSHILRIYTDLGFSSGWHWHPALQVAPLPPWCATITPSPALSIWEWEFHFRPTVCQGARQSCSVVRISMQTGAGQSRVSQGEWSQSDLASLYSRRGRGTRACGERSLPGPSPAHGHRSEFLCWGVCFRYFYSLIFVMLRIQPGPLMC